MIALGALGALVSFTQFTPTGAASVLHRALFACAAAGWFVLVCDFALNVVVPKVALRRGLPAPMPAGGAAIGGAEAAGELGEAEPADSAASKATEPADSAACEPAAPAPEPADDEPQQAYEADEGDA